MITDSKVNIHHSLNQKYIVLQFHDRQGLGEADIHDTSLARWVTRYSQDIHKRGQSVDVLLDGH